MESIRPWSTPNNRRGSRLIFIGLGIAAFVVLAVSILNLFSEQYFSPAPAIGTTFTANYDEARFDQIRVGMSRDKVIELLGDPFEKSNIATEPVIVGLYKGDHNTAMPADSAEMWAYSQDGGIGMWDFAWLGRYVYFDDVGQVTGTVESVYYD